MTELPYVSALIVMRNERNYIKPSLMSFVNQTYPKDRYEIIVVDGCSDDGTVDIVNGIIREFSTDSFHYAVYTFMRVLGCFPCLGFLALTTPIAKILNCLRRLYVPKILIEIALLMYNTIFIFLNEIDTMQKAQDTRLGYHSYWTSFKSLGALVSTIFLRSLDKSETLQFALDSRGYTGELPVYEPRKKEN